MGCEPSDSFRLHGERRAAAHTWEFDQVEGDLSLTKRLMNANRNDVDFLVVPPGLRIAARYNDGIITAEPVDK